MSAPGQDQQPSPVMQADRAAVENALLWAIQRSAEKGSSAADTREQQEAADAALKFAQAVVVLDPSLSQGGTPLEHDIALETVRQQGQAAVAQINADAQVRQAREAAAAPTPAKRRSVAVRRDAHGRAQGYDVTDG